MVVFWFIHQSKALGVPSLFINSPFFITISLNVNDKFSLAYVTVKLHRTGSRRILHVENHKEETRKAFSEISGDLFSQTPTQEVSDVNMVISKTLEK